MISSSASPISDLVELVKRQADPVIGDAALRIVVGTDALGPVATADLPAPRTRPFLVGTLALPLV